MHAAHGKGAGFRVAGGAHHVAIRARATRITRLGRCTRRHGLYVGPVDEVERLLRMLALGDDESVAKVLAAGTANALSPALKPKVDALVRLGALLALGASTSSLRGTVDRAIALGASQAEITDVLVAVGPAVGLARIVSGAPRLAAALGYDLEDVA